MLLTASSIAETLEGRQAEDGARIRALQKDVAVLWAVAYEGLERGDAFYALVERKTGQTREQVEHYFAPKHDD